MSDPNDYTDMNSGWFSLRRGSAGKLKTFSASSRASTHTLKLEVTFDSPVEMGYAVEELTKLLSRPDKPKRAAKLLALPAPRREA